MIALTKGSSVLLVVALMSGCASGTKLSETAVATTDVPAGKTRIVVYRDQVMGAAVQPEITVDAAPTGKCQPKGVFFVDVPAGMHRLTAMTETTSAINVDTSKYRVAYVKCSIGFGLFVGRPSLTQVASESGVVDTGELVLTGTYALP